MTPIENFECKVTGNARQQRRRLDTVTSAAVIQDDFLCLDLVDVDEYAAFTADSVGLKATHLL